ncbi:peptide deformylase [Pseudonocardia sp. GCM10023141]|uniref:peptide deformylase n=1 Tax=Pseudonocardia sp. GCM10023141 TaxID=3252653 RepID=UPI003611FBBD
MAGTARPITMHGDPVLHRPCRPVTVFDDALAALVEDMFASMYAASGVGLAANQIGVDARVFVLDCPDLDTRERTVGHVVNPVLELPPPPRELVERAEGCLSVPGASAELARAVTAVVTGVDVRGEPVTIAGRGLVARCLQHESDHLDGLLYVDRLPAAARRAALAEAFPGG